MQKTFIAFKETARAAMQFDIRLEDEQSFNNLIRLLRFVSANSTDDTKINFDPSGKDEKITIKF